MPDSKPAYPLLGRDKTLESLRKLMDSTGKSKGAFIIINGEAGIGKTAIVRQMEDEAQAKGWAIFSGECLVGKGGDPYLPIITAAKRYLDRRGDSWKNKDVPSLPMGLMGASTREDLVDTWRTVKELKNERERLFENVLDLIRDALERSPVLFCIDDLHWAEISALQLLYYIVRSTSNQKVMVIGTYRTEELDNPRMRHPLHEILSRAKQEDLLTTMELKRLNEHDTGRLVNLLAATKVQPSLIKKIYQESGGNPFFIKEFMRDLQITGKMSADSITIPSSVSLLIKNRLKDLDHVQQEAMQACAVLGQQFNYDLLLSVAQMKEMDLVDAVDGLIGYRVLEEKAVGNVITYAFSHHLMREVVYDGLSAARKRMLHAKSGEMLEAMFEGKLDQAVYQLAYHYSRTSMTAKAYKYTAMAGMVSMGQMAMEEARQSLEESLAMLQKLEPDKGMGFTEVELLNALGRVHNFLGNIKRALDCHHKAMDLSEKDSLDMAHALRNLAEVQIEIGKWKGSIETFKKAIKISENQNDPRGVAEGYRGLTWLAVELGDHEDAIRYAERAITEAKRAGDKYLQGKVFIDLGNLYNIQAENTKALNYYEDALKILDPSRHLDQLARVYNNIGDVYMNMGDYKRALDNFENCLEIARVTGDHRRIAYGQTNVGYMLGKKGKREEALENLDAAMAEFQRTEDTYGMAIVMLSKAMMELTAKNYKAGEEFYKKAIDFCREHEFDLLLGVGLAEYGVLLKRWGKKAEALKMLDEMLKFKAGLEKKTKVGGWEESLNELMELKK